MLSPGTDSVLPYTPLLLWIRLFSRVQPIIVYQFSISPMRATCSIHHLFNISFLLIRTFLEIRWFCSRSRNSMSLCKDPLPYSEKHPLHCFLSQFNPFPVLTYYLKKFLELLKLKMSVLCRIHEWRTGEALEGSGRGLYEVLLGVQITSWLDSDSHES
jgi:hypothetical protein